MTSTCLKPSFIHTNTHTHTRTCTRTHIHAMRRPLCQRAEGGGGGMGGSHFKLTKRGRGLSWQTGCILALNQIIRRKTENKQHAWINSVKAAFAALRLLLSKRVNPVHWWANHMTLMYKSIRPRTLIKPGAGGRPSWVSCEGEINGNCVSF